MLALHRHQGLCSNCMRMRHKRCSIQLVPVEGCKHRNTSNLGCIDSSIVLDSCHLECCQLQPSRNLLVHDMCNPSLLGHSCIHMYYSRKMPDTGSNQSLLNWLRSKSFHRCLSIQHSSCLLSCNTSK